MSWFESLFGFKERTGSAEAWEWSRSQFSLSSSGALLCPNGKTYQAGTFSTPSLSELRAAVAALPLTPGSVTVTHAATEDVLRDHALHPHATFLAASGLNALEFTSPSSAPEHGITGYEHDRTQGPACALACAAGTVVRNYFAGNSPTGQLDALAELSAALPQPPAFQVRSGYISAPAGAAALAALAAPLAEGSPSREALRGLVRIGLQRSTQVTFGSRFAPPPPPATAVTQVYASALSLGAYGDASIPDAAWAPLATLVLEAAYEATLLAALLCAPPGQQQPPRVFLSGLGMGVFGNPPAWVAAAMARAVRAVQARGAALHVTVQHFRAVDTAFKAAVEAPVPWPLERLLVNTQAAAAAAAAAPPRLAVLLSTGALNPPHLGHLAIMATARERLQQEGYTVVGGYLSPSHDLYLQGKRAASGGGTVVLPPHHRLQLVDMLAAADADAAAAPPAPPSSAWLCAAAWECSAVGDWPDYPEVVRALLSALKGLNHAHPQLAAATVFYVCGRDHWDKCGRFTMLGYGVQAGTVVVSRGGEGIGAGGGGAAAAAAAAPQDSPQQLLFHAHNSLASTVDLSSTALRAALSAGEDVGFAVPAAVAPELLRMYREAGGGAAPGAGAGAGAGAAAGTAAGAAGAAAVGPRLVFISLTALSMDLAAGRIPAGVLESPRTLFFFGSKRFWLWPASAEQRAESLTQGRKYLDLPEGTKALILAKEARGEVHFLKPDVLGAPDEVVFGDFEAASQWLAGLGEGPLQLREQWWQEAWAAGVQGGRMGKYARSAGEVVENFKQGLHDYGPVCELLLQAGLEPVLQWERRGRA